MAEEQELQQNPEPEPEVVTPGKLLRAAREAKGLSVTEVAKKLYLKPDLINDIEGDIYDEEMSLTFVKGYLKLYAKHLDLEEAEVLKAFDPYSDSREKPPAQLQSFSKRIAKETSDDRLNMVTYLIAVVIIALAVWWWWQQSRGGEITLPSLTSSVGSQSDDEQQSTSIDQGAEPQTAAAQDQAQNNGDAVMPEVEQVETVSLAEQLQSQNPDVAATTPASEPPAVEEVDQAAESSEPQGSSDSPVPSVDEGGVNFTSRPEPLDKTTDSGAEDAPADVVEQAVTDAAAQPRTETIDEGAGEGGQGGLGEGQAPVMETSQVAVSDGVDSAEVAPAGVFDPEDLVQLEFQFSADCWINITDASGEAIAYGVKAEGRTMPVSGYPPFEVVLGAPEVVQISYNGAPIDMSGFRAGRTARFTLPLVN